MTYKEFRLRFAIQYVGSVSDPGECMRRMDNAPSLARLLWDVMNAPEPSAPSAPIAAQPPDLKPSNSTELKALARTVLDFFSDDVQWIAIDANGEVWAYDLKPTIDETRSNWDNSDDDGVAWEIGAVEPPADYRNEIYEISKLIDND